MVTPLCMPPSAAAGGAAALGGTAKRAEFAAVV